MVGVIYRHPNSNLHIFKINLENSINKLNENKVKYMFCGDTNIDLFKNNNFTSDYVDSLLSLGCTQHIESPTRKALNGSSETLLDHFHSNINSNNLNSKVILNDISDHFPIIAQIKFNLDCSSKQFIMKRDMKNFDKLMFVTDLKLEMEPLINSTSDNLYDSVDSFLKKI